MIGISYFSVQPLTTLEVTLEYPSPCLKWHSVARGSAISYLSKLLGFFLTLSPLKAISSMVKVHRRAIIRVVSGDELHRKITYPNCVPVISACHSNVSITSFPLVSNETLLGAQCKHITRGCPNGLQMCTPFSDNLHMKEEEEEAHSVSLLVHEFSAPFVFPCQLVLPFLTQFTCCNSVSHSAAALLISSAILFVNWFTLDKVLSRKTNCPRKLIVQGIKRRKLGFGKGSLQKTNFLQDSTVLDSIPVCSRYLCPEPKPTP